MALRNKTKDKQIQDPLFHLIKRDALPLYKAALIRLSAILFALLFSGILTFILTKVTPFTIYQKMLYGTFGNRTNLLTTIENLALLLCVSLAVTPAFKMRFWNTGAEGQVLVGGLATATCMYYLSDLPLGLLMLFMLLTSLIAGAIWGIIPAYFKANWGTNETLFTLMMNYVAMRLIEFFMKKWNQTSASVDFTKLDRDLRINALFNGQTDSHIRKYLFCILSVLLIAMFLYIYLRSSKHGYEISVVGESENTARYIGINVKKVTIRTMALSGLICGFAGFLLVGTSQNISPDIADGRGFTAIMVSWLAKFNPIMMILASFLLVFLDLGMAEVATSLNLTTSLSDIITGIMLFFIIGCEFFIQYKLIPGHRMKSLFQSKKSDKEVA